MKSTVWPTRPPCGYAKTIPALDELRRKALHPTHNRGVHQRQTALGHHLDQIAQAELVAKVPAYAENNDLSIEMSPIKQRLQAFPLTHHRTPDCWAEYFNQFAEPVCTRTFEPLLLVPCVAPVCRKFTVYDRLWNKADLHVFYEDGATTADFGNWFDVA
jgi:hypothetical protein